LRLASCVGERLLVHAGWFADCRLFAGTGAMVVLAGSLLLAVVGDRPKETCF
jgi:hypothetical protein